jgi:hypothetical protein
MNTVLLFADALSAPARLGAFLINLLAVAGGAAVGWFGVGLIVKVAARFLTTRRVPEPVLIVLRLMGAIVVAWAVGMWVFGPGGPGWGLGREGTGGGQEGGEKKENAGSTAASGKDRSEDEDKAPAGSILRIELLGDPRVGRDRFYRVDGEKDLLTIDDVRHLVTERTTKQPPLQRLVIVTYANSPSEDNDQFKKLRELAKEFKLFVKVDPRGGNAP